MWNRVAGAGFPGTAGALGWGSSSAASPVRAFGGWIKLLQPVIGLY